MSTLRVDNIRHNSATSDAITTATDGTCTARITGMTGGGGLSHRNAIVNGAMNVAQRGTQSTGNTTAGYTTVDRFQLALSAAGTWTTDQSSVTDLAGFSKAFKVTCTTANGDGSNLSNSAGILACQYRAEGQDIQGFHKGFPSAKQYALSFYVKSNKTGTYVVEVLDVDNSRHICKSYTVSSASTWEKKTLILDADTTGKFDNDNNHSLQLRWYLAAGTNFTSGTLATSWASNTGANKAVGNVNLAQATSNFWEITGVQLEVGDTATSFEHRSFADELARCQRYYYQVGPLQTDVFGQGRTDNDNLNMLVLIHYPVTMRSSPATLTTTGSAGNYDVRRDTTKGCSAVPTIHTTSSIHLAQVICQSNSHGWGTASPMQLQADGGGTAFLGFSAEL